LINKYCSCNSCQASASLPGPSCHTAHHVAHGAAGHCGPVCLVLLHGAAQPKVSKLGSQASSRQWAGANQHVMRSLRSRKEAASDRRMKMLTITTKLAVDCNFQMPLFSAR
jgi:hypothetical protein